MTFSYYLFETPHKSALAVQKMEAKLGSLSRKQQKTYERYARSESARKALVYQKKYLLLCIGGFQETEEKTIKLLAEPTAIEKRPNLRFRAAVRAVMAINR